MPRQCAFCPNSASLSGEHLWSQWIGDELGSRPYTFTRIDTDGSVNQWKNDELNVKAKVVCKSCNNGWMSDLESKTKPILKDMILHCRETALRARDIALVAAVTFKNAVIADHMHDRRSPFFTIGERRDFRERQEVPPGAQMWLASIANQRGLFKSMYAEIPGRDSLAFHLNIFTYAVGHFVIQAVSSRYKRRNDRRHAPQLYLTQDSEWDAVSIPCWPSNGSVIKWPPSAHMGGDVVDAFIQRWTKLTLGPGLGRRAK
jgi:hypothetical protein